MTLGHFVCTVLEVGFRAVPSKSLAALVVVGDFSAGLTIMIYYRVYELGLNFKLSLIWMVQLG